MPSRRDALVSGGSAVAATLFGPLPPIHAQETFSSLRKAVGKRACYKCDDRGQVQANVGGGKVDKPHVDGLPDVAWLQEGYILCPDCLGESKEFRTACSQIKDGVLPWTKLARKKIDELKSAGTLKEIRDKAAKDQPAKSRLPGHKLFVVKGVRHVEESQRGTKLIAHFAAHFRAGTMTRGVVRAVVVRWGLKTTTRAVDFAEEFDELIDTSNLISCQDLLKAAASSMDVKYRESCGFPPAYNSLPTFTNKTLPENFPYRYLG